MKRYKLVQPALVCACILWHSTTLHAQAPDTLSLTLPQAEQQFLQQNLQLIAGRYGVQADSALILQARLWNNPNLTTDQNIYSNNHWLEHGTNADGSPKGQYLVQLEFLIRTAGKRSKNIQLAKTEAGISSWQFRDMLLSLRVQLREDFYKLVQLQLNDDLYRQQLDQTNHVVSLMKKQLESGNIARKDLLRLQALQIGLQQDAVENATQLSDVQNELRTMLQLGSEVYIHPLSTIRPVTGLPAQNMEQLKELARNNNPAYNIQQLQVSSSRQNLSLQKAMAVPDLTVSPNYDLNSNYTPRYYGLGISLPLPVFNRNQGNIRSAKMQVKQQETNMTYAEGQLGNDVTNAWRKLQLTLQLSASGGQDTFYTNYGQLYDNIVESYKQRQISLIEFVDYFNAYKDIRQRQAQKELNIEEAREELNLRIGLDVL